MIMVIATLLKIGAYDQLALVINPICGGLVLIGGIILITDRAVGSILALIGSISFVILSFIPDPAGGYLTASYFNHYYIDAILAIVGVLAARRKRKPEEQDALEAARVSSISEGETVALPPIPPAEAAQQEPGTGEEAKKMIDSTQDRLSDYQEAHPDDALDVEPVMEKLDIARGFLSSGEYDDALAFAMEADAAVKKMTRPAITKRVAVKKKKAVVARKICPECGEELKPEWTACPACGRKTLFSLS